MTIFSVIRKRKTKSIGSFASYLFDWHTRTTVGTIAHWSTIIGCFFLALDNRRRKEKTFFSFVKQ
jgi:hypothetical protein